MFNELAMFEKRLSHSKPRQLVSFQQDFWRNDAIFFTLYYVKMLQSLFCMMDYIYIIKTCRTGVPHFEKLSLQQPEDTNTAGQHMALQNPLESAKFTFDRKN